MCVCVRVCTSTVGTIEQPKGKSFRWIKNRQYLVLHTNWALLSLFRSISHVCPTVSVYDFFSISRWYHFRMDIWAWTIANGKCSHSLFASLLFPIPRSLSLSYIWKEAMHWQCACTQNDSDIRTLFPSLKRSVVHCWLIWLHPHNSHICCVMSPFKCECGALNRTRWSFAMWMRDEESEREKRVKWITSSNYKLNIFALFVSTLKKHST